MGEAGIDRFRIAHVLTLRRVTHSPVTVGYDRYRYNKEKTCRGRGVVTTHARSRLTPRKPMARIRRSTCIGPRVGRRVAAAATPCAARIPAGGRPTAAEPPLGAPRPAGPVPTPARERFRRDPELLANRPDRGPLRRVLILSQNGPSDQPGTIQSATPPSRWYLSATLADPKVSCVRRVPGDERASRLQRRRRSARATPRTWGLPVSRRRTRPRAPDTAPQRRAPPRR